MASWKVGGDIHCTHCSLILYCWNTLMYSLHILGNVQDRQQDRKIVIESF